MTRFFELYLRSGIRPMNVFPETFDLERTVRRSEIPALLLLYFRGAMPTSELAVAMGIPASTMTSMIKRLVRKGLVERQHSPKDGRVILVQLTESGCDLALKVKTTMERMYARIQSALTPDELDQFLHLAGKVVKALSQENS